MTSERNPLRLWRNPWVRVGVVAVLLAALAWVLYENTDVIDKGVHHVREADGRWIALGVLALAGAMFAQAEMMVVLLRGAGVRVGRWAANMLGLAANAWSASLPGGPAVSATMIFLRQKAWGAGSVVAAWYLVISGVLAGAGMAVLGLCAVLFLDASINPLTLISSILVLVALVAAFRWLGRNPQTVQRWVEAVLRRFNRLTRAPEDRWVDKFRELVDELGAVDVPPRTLGLALFWAIANWCLEIACLYACLISVGVEPTLSGTVLAFLLAKLVGQAQITPGGLGPVDVAMVSLLVPLAQVPSAAAVGGVFVFRAVSFVGLAAVGWLVFFVQWLLGRRD